MKINVKKIKKKMNSGKIKIVHLIECYCGEEVVFKEMPDEFKCPTCKKCISILEIKENKKRRVK